MMNEKTLYELLSKALGRMDILESQQEQIMAELRILKLAIDSIAKGLKG